MTEAQSKIDAILQSYKKNNKEEYLAFIKQQRYLWMNTTKFAEIKKADYVERGIKEVPETLFKQMQAKLSDADFEYFNSKEGSRWFVKRNREFAMAEEV